MNKLKIKESYLILLIVVSLVSLGIYTTYALFTASTTINDVVGITATLDIGKSMSEYEVVTVPAGETKLIELNVTNSYNGNIYYGAWYQIVKGNSDNIQIGLYTERNSNPGSGSLSSSSNINLLVGITNDNSTSVTLYIGVKGSLTNELNLGTNKILIPDGFSEALLVTEEVLEAHKKTKTGSIPVNKEFSATGAVQNVTLNTGTFKLEVWGAQGGSYSTTYVGGKGGYSYGTLTLSNTTNLYVYVGKQGSAHSTTTGGTSAGGFNGGGSAKTVAYSGTTSYVTGGGGASDIRIGQDSLYARVIVAGGGSGSSNGNSGYYGGGTSAGYGVSGYGGTTTTAGTNGSFGVGANAAPSSTNYKYASPGGGGGWYGGGSSGTNRSDSTNYRTYTGGGSGYVYTSSTASNYPSGNLLTSTYYLTDAATLAGNTSFTSTSGGTETGHSGDGYAKITGNEIGTITYYTIPNLTGLSDLRIQLGKNVSLTDGTTLTCENNTTTGCSITSISITDTSTLTEGTHVVTYTVKGANNKKYLFNRNIIVVDSPIIPGSLGERILLDNPTVLTRSDFSTTNTENTTGKIYKQSSTETIQKTEDINGDGIGEDVYYFSGNHTNNWFQLDTINDSDYNPVSSGVEKLYRIIRINEDGSVRLLSSTPVTSVEKTSSGRSYKSSTEYNSSSLNGVYYMNGTTDSDIKKYVDNYYSYYFLDNYDKYISKTAIYCNDTSKIKVQGGLYNQSTIYGFGSYIRNKVNKSPSYRCGSNAEGGLMDSTQNVDDKFSVSTSSGGNGRLTYPIALPTVDELVYAGALYHVANSNAWFTYDGIWWTMSPSSITNGYNEVWQMMDGDTTYTRGISSIDEQVVTYSIDSGRGDGDSTRDWEEYRVRIALSLKACAKYASGNGSSSNPYTVTVDEECANAEN